VTAGERQAVLDAYKQERNFLAVLKATTKSPDKILEKIKSTQDINEFLDQARENPKILEKVASKTEATKISETWKEKGSKKKKIKQELRLTTKAPEGISDLKDILQTKDAKVSYLGSSRFEISLEADDFKTANTQLQTLIETIKKKAEKKNAQLTVKEK
jgi:translation initiation factor 2 alpha subunit (eIF-2alpha)